MINSEIPKPPQAPKSIPWPANVRQLRRSTTACEKLRVAMQTWSKQEFSKLTFYLRNTAKHFLDTSKVISEQDSDQWKAFMKKVARDYPTLETFASLWPVQIYVEKYLLYVSWRRPKPIENPTTRRNDENRDEHDEVEILTHSNGEDNTPGSTAPCTPPAPKQVLQTSRKHKVTFVGKTPPRFQRLRSKQGKTKDAVARPSDSGSHAASASAAASNDVFHSPHPSIPESTGNQHKLPFSSSTFSHQNTFPTIGSGLLMRTNSMTTSSPIACFGCGFLPPIPESRLVKLRKFLTGTEYLVPIFTGVGILHDHQLQIFLSWCEADRKDFFQKLVPYRLSNLQFATLNTKILGCSDSPVNQEKRKLGDNPRLPSHPKKMKFEVIEISDEEDDSSDEDDEGNIAASKRHQTPQEEHVGSTVNALTSNVPKPDSIRCPACAYIPLIVPRFSLLLKTFLRACSMEELMPAFTSLGIFTDKDFDHLSKMNEVKRDELFRKGPIVKLNEFQCKVLQMAFRRLNGM